MLILVTPVVEASSIPGLKEQRGAGIDGGHLHTYLVWLTGRARGCGFVDLWICGFLSCGPKEEVWTYYISLHPTFRVSPYKKHWLRSAEVGIS